MKPLLTVLAIGASLGIVGLGGLTVIQPSFISNNLLGFRSNENSEINQRQAYNAIDLTQLQGELTGNDPEAIALSTFGVGEPQEGNFEETVQVEPQSTRRTIVTLTQMGLADDSVRGMRYRLELEPDRTTSSQWRVVWAGRQHRCQPERGSQDWTTELCI